MATISLSNLTVVADPGALATAAAERIATRLRTLPGRGAVCLTGGSTPKRLYEILAAEPYRSALPWERLHWFWTDERFVAADDPLSNAGMARKALFDRAPVPPGNVHPIPTAGGSPEAAADRYAAELRNFYGADHIEAGRPLFDVVIMGMGPDGHTASLFPGKPAVAETARWAVGVAEAGWEPFVPRVTLTLPALAACRDMIFLVSGAGKSEALSRVLASADVPSARAHADGTLVVLADRAAAAPEASHGD